jgi:hypothetical protein
MGNKVKVSSAASLWVAIHSTVNTTQDMPINYEVVEMMLFKGGRWNVFYWN